MLKGIEEIAKETIQIIKDIEILMKKTKNKIQENKPKIYSKDLLESLFYHPYTKISFIEGILSVTRKTASSYLTYLEMGRK
ncbi:hypothetical protein KO488_02895 [Poseidonibacter lekithochrous]|uniref:hypothetical protein n=1 Tax=Poseidonibacter TaxID=2321187 RepID=UPI001C084247|nr:MULTISPECIES: hypothetical protein [Poseidonibacter]MBU3013690.1 hypothetical protein [Poseidonibacter lekithochrous]MDO6826987.1 hypothetical protein [Poseidonibacter sp. 1_MG-2023]